MSDLVYFSSVSENTKRFVDRLGRAADRLPLRRHDPQVRADRPFVLVTPTYGSGDWDEAVPRQVRRFLRDPANRSLLRGVISSGNTNFGASYALAGRVVATTCHVPWLYTFELIGTDADLRTVTSGLDKFWQHQPPHRQPSTQPLAA